MRALRAAVLSLAIALAFRVSPAHAEAPIAVIIHPKRTATLDRTDVARIYLRQRRFWDDGEAIVALNQPPGSAIREEFFRKVVGSDSASLGDYWNELYFHGVFPPIALSSTEAVKRYIASNRNAIGYVYESEVDSSVRVVLIVRDKH
jgi:ABC-type phosphate transport system substrate-binding protein